MQVSDDNPIRELVSLETDLSPYSADAEHLKLSCYLRFFPCEMAVDKIGLFKVQVSRATLVLNLEGFRVVPMSRLGEIFKQAVCVSTVQTEVTKQSGEEATDETNSSAGMALSAINPKIDGSAGAKSLVKTTAGATVKETISEQRLTRNVSISGPDRWQFENADQSDLDGTYLRPDEPLCLLSDTRAANRKHIATTVSVRQKHLTFDLVERENNLGFLNPLNHNQNRICDIILSKAIHKKISAATPYSGYAVLCQSVIADDR